MKLYDPLRKGVYAESKVCRGSGSGTERKYFRFRGGRWYGGIASGDVIGCNLACRFCWAWRFRDRYDLGRYYRPESAYLKLKFIAERRRYKLLRLTGGEPTLCVDHLLALADLALRDGYSFLVETNGLLIGSKKWVAEEIARRSGLIVRVSFKGVNEEDFVKLTGASPYGYRLQFRAIKNLLDEGMKPCEEVVPAAMISFSSDEEIAAFVTELSDLDHVLPGCIDWEVVILYPHVERLLRKYGLKPKRYVKP